MLVQGGDGAHKEFCGFPCDPPIDLAGGFAITTSGGAIVLVQDDVPLAGGMDGQAGQHAALPDPSTITISTSTYPTLALAAPVLDPGSTAPLSLAGEPGPALFGFSAFALTPISLPGLDGELFLQIGASMLVSVVLPPSGVLDLQLVLPPAPALSGLKLVGQLVSRSGGNPLISTPALLVVR